VYLVAVNSGISPLIHNNFVRCEPGNYGDGVTCVACPLKASSPMGSKSIQDCVVCMHACMYACMQV
jgi:hypothetical protein